MPGETGAGPRGSRSRIRLAAIALALAFAACARRAAPPSAEAPPPRPLNLAGVSVMVLPAQTAGTLSDGVARAFDSELAYWLADRAPRVHWIGAAEMERLAKSSPALRVDLHALDVRAFGHMRLQRIGDPLFGDIHNLGAVVDARLALLPAGIAYVTPADTGAAAAGPDAGRIEVTAAVIQTFGGEVVWYGVVAGEPGPRDAPEAIASAAQALAKALTPGN